MRRLVLTLLKVAVSAALLYLAMRHTDFSALFRRITPATFAWLALALAASLTQTTLAGLRWHLVSGCCGAPLDGATAIRFNLIGTFFNQTLPSSIGGDAVRLWLVSRRSGWQAASYSVFSDRAIGLIALALLILVCLPWSLSLVADPKGRVALLAIEAAALGAGMIFLLLGTPGGRLLEEIRAVRHARHCAQAALAALIDPARGLSIAVLSFTIHILTAVTAWAAARSIAAPVDFAQLLLLLPPVSLISLLPVSIAGWGLRETAMGAAFATAGLATAEGVNVSLVFGAVNFVAGALGGLVWVFSGEKSARGEQPVEAPPDLA